MTLYAEVIGLDIGPRSAKVVHAARRGRRTVFLGTGRVRLSDNPEESQRVLQRFLEKHGWSGLPCVVGVSGDALLLRPVTVEASGRESIEDAVARQMEHFDSLAGPETLRVRSPIRRRGDRRRLLFAVTRQAAVQRALDRAQQADLRVVDMQPDPVALYNAVAELRPASDAPVVCLDLGWEGTEVLVGQGADILFARHIPIGQRLLNREPGAPDSATAGEWLREVESCMTFYRQQAEPLPPPRELALCGAEGLPEGLLALTLAQTGLRPLDFSALLFSGQPPREGRWAVAVGLALAGLGRDRVPLSLLPTSLRERAVIEGQFRYWAALGAALLATVLAGIAGMRWDVRRLGSDLQDLGEQLQTFQRQGQELEALQRANGEWRRQLHPLRTAVRNGEIARWMLPVTAAAKHPDDWIVRVADARSYFQTDPASPAAAAAVLPRTGAGSSAPGTGLRAETAPPPDAAADPTAPAAPPPEPGFQQMVVEGYTPVPDLSTVRGMIEKLRKDPLVAAADLLADDRVRLDPERDRQWQDANVRLFAVELTIAPAP